MKRQRYIPIVRSLTHWEAPNRKTFRCLRKMKQVNHHLIPDSLTFERITQKHKTDTENREFKEFRSEIAREFGSTTGKLKKKHLNRQNEKAKFDHDMECENGTF